QMDEVSLFENHGVNVKLDSPYLWGSPRNMVKQIAAAAGISWVIDRNVLAIMPQNKARGGGGLLVAPETGMVSYPGFTAVGVLVKQEFSRALSYRQKFTVKSDIVPACGDWMINRLEYDLESEVPKGHWFVTIEASGKARGPPCPPELFSKGIFAWQGRATSGRTTPPRRPRASLSGTSTS